MRGQREGSRGEARQEARWRRGREEGRLQQRGWLGPEGGMPSESPPHLDSAPQAAKFSLPPQPLCSTAVPWGSLAQGMAVEGRGRELFSGD